MINILKSFKFEQWKCDENSQNFHENFDELYKNL